VAITQPRRIAAISLAKRVKEELNMTYTGSIGNEVSGYQVRWEHSKNFLTCPLKYMTDGILLNEMMSDKLLLNYDYIVIDEAHERKMVTDVLIGLLIKIGKTLISNNI
jgi:HrpA-like RNA helicase